MKKNKMKKFKLTLTLAAVISSGAFGLTVSAQPGTPSDPLVSRSYLEARIATLEGQINTLMALIDAEGVSAPAINASITLHNINIMLLGLYRNTNIFIMAEMLKSILNDKIIPFFTLSEKRYHSQGVKD